MKANGVPDKLYCCDKGNGNIFVDYRPFPNDDNIEYIRTDAFIEKACEWLKESVTNNSKCNRIISKKGMITMGLLIEDFRAYMEGE